MSLEELGQEYLQQYKTIMQRIAEIRRRGKNLGGEKARLDRIRIRELLATAVHLKEVGDRLISYYDKRGRKTL